jgi:DNA-directed RNA polymerase subunit M/transcription elongation factor TFIIS
MMEYPVNRYTSHADGYVRLYFSDGRVQLEHRYIMEQHLGRSLAKDEYVHHKDANKQNNALENLEVLSPSAHSRHHKPATGRTIVQLVCGECREEFEREARFVKGKQRDGQEVFFCSRACGTRFTKALVGTAARAPREQQHGTRYNYTRGKCRCTECRAAQAAYMRQYQQKRHYS